MPGLFYTVASVTGLDTVTTYRGYGYVGPADEEMTAPARLERLP